MVKMFLTDSIKTPCYIQNGENKWWSIVKMNSLRLKEEMDMVSDKDERLKTN